MLVLEKIVPYSRIQNKMITKTDWINFIFNRIVRETFLKDKWYYCLINYVNTYFMKNLIQKKLIIGFYFFFNKYNS